MLKLGSTIFLDPCLCVKVRSFLWTGVAYFTPLPALGINLRRVHRADSDADGINLRLSHACGAAGDIDPSGLRLFQTFICASWSF